MNVILTNLLSVAFALGIIIVVHEAGHLLMAKTFSVRVLTFSVGFGKRLLGFNRGETDYRLSAIPLGGYVRLDGESPEDASGDPRQFMSRSRWQRALVFLAGPAMNVVLSIGLFTGLYWVGINAPNLPAIAPVIGALDAGSPGERAGLRRGDLILRINGEPARSWQEVSLALLTAPDKPVALEVRRGARVSPATVVPKRVRRDDVGAAGIYPVIRPQINEVIPGKPAAAAGLRAGDEV